MGKKRSKDKGGPTAMEVFEGGDRDGGGASSSAGAPETAMDTTERVATASGVVATSTKRKGFLVGRNKNEAQIRKNKKKRKSKALERALVVQEKEHNKLEKEREKKERKQTLKSLY